MGPGAVSSSQNEQATPPSKLSFDPV